MSQRWQGHAPHDRGDGPIYTVVWPKIGRPIEGTILGERFTGVNVHWEGDRTGGTRRSVFCPGPESCPRCRHAIALDWRGYVAIHNVTLGRITMLVVGLDVFRTLNTITPPGSSLLGLRFVFVRLGGSDFNEVAVHQSSLPAHPFRRPLPNILPTLARLYGPAVRAVFDADQADGQQPTPTPTPTHDTPAVVPLSHFKDMLKRARG